MSLRGPSRPRVELVPRFEAQGYAPEHVTERRRWLAERTGATLEHIASGSQPTTSMRGNVENPIGVAQLPLGVAGPLLVRGGEANGTFYVPMATTEGALVRSYERGMVALTHAGGAAVRVHRDENRIAPSFSLPDIETAADFSAWIGAHREAIRRAAESTTRHGKLIGLQARPLGRNVIVEFSYSTGDASGMNMLTTATDAACRWILDASAASGFHLFSGAESEKHSGATLLAGGKGKYVTAGVQLPPDVLEAVFRCRARDIVRLWQDTVAGHLQAGVVGYNGHFANGLAAIFIACGQDVANVMNSAVGITRFEETEDGGLYASVTLPSLTLATVGGGTGLATSRECLEILGCFGDGKARKLAEIVGAALLAGELSMGAAVAAGELATAHQSLGRNPPSPGP